MKRPSQVVILCGGLGTRLRPYTDQIPKPMIPCNNKPFLWYLLQQLSEQGVGRFVLLTGYLAEYIENYFGDGSAWGWQIQYSKGPVDWDTGKRIWEAKEKLDDRFVLLYSDNYVPFSLDTVLEHHEKNARSLTFMVSPKSPGNISLDETGIVKKYDNDRSDKELNYVEIGYMIVDKEQTFGFFENPECSFSFVLRKMVAKQEISAWIQQDLYHSISDPMRWQKAEQYLKPKKIILIDRDGVINRKAPRGEYVSKWEEFEWIPATVDAMKALAEDGFKFIILSNQAGIARNMIKPAELERINAEMRAKFRKTGIDILDIFVCPHHWEDNCDCRKPKPGMFYQASREWVLMLNKTLFVGDDPRDCQAAYNAGCRSVFVGDNSKLNELSDKERPINVSANLTDALPVIRNFFRENNNYDYY